MQNLIEADRENEAIDHAKEISKISRFHKRTLLLGALLVAAISILALYVDLVQQLPLGVLQIAPGAVGGFLVVYAAIKLMKRMGFLKWMNSADYYILYFMLFIGVFVSTRGLIEKLIPMLVAPDRSASVLDGSRLFWLAHINPSLVAVDPRGRTDVSIGFYQGIGIKAIPWLPWIKPLLCWLVIFLFVIGAFICLSSLLSHRWTDQERLAFPHTALPLILIDDAESKKLFSNRITWLGIAVPMTVYLFNGLHLSIPSIPEIPLYHSNIFQFFTTPPWNQIQWTDIYISFAALGLAYLLPADLLFSLWFFFMVTRISTVAAATYNLQITWSGQYHTPEFISYISIGAYIAIAVRLAASVWPDLVTAYTQLIGKGHKTEDKEENEPIAPRKYALLGLLICFAGILIWSVWAGMNVWFAMGVWTIYILVSSVVLTRGVSEAGILMTETSFRPGEFIEMFVAKSAWGGTNLATLSMLNAVFFRDLRGCFMALFMDSQKVAGDAGFQRRSLIYPIIAAIPIAFIVGAITHLWISYHHGQEVLQGYGIWAAGVSYDDVHNTLQQGYHRMPTAIPWTIFGVVITAMMAYARANVAGFPFLPIAFAIAPTWTLIVLWFPFFVMWIIKSLILRYGGGGLYHRLMPFFIGMIIGEFASVTIWSILAATLHITAPTLQLP